MRLYENLITTNLALLDLPNQKYGQRQNVRRNYLEEIFRQLLIYDQSSENDFASVLNEASETLSIADPAFRILFHNDFEQYVSSNRHKLRWEKVKKDYHYYMESEKKRRYKENPYQVQKINDISSWEKIPDFSKQKRNQPWQFDPIYKDAQQLAGVVYEITKHYEQLRDPELFRAKINSILVPEKLIYALNSGENIHDFVENEMSVINFKLSLDGYKSAQVFLNRVIESLHKIRWNHEDRVNTIDETIYFANQMLTKLTERILDNEKRFLLFLGALE